MIRNVTIHVNNEQPLLCDLFDLPNSTDAGLLCTNVRSTDGKRPVFIDAIASTFLFPYHVVRFIEIPEGALAGRPAVGRPSTDAAAGNGTRNGAGHDDEPAANGTYLPVLVDTDEPPADGDLEIDLEIDEGFLQRIRDI